MTKLNDAKALERLALKASIEGSRYRAAELFEEAAELVLEAAGSSFIDANAEAHVVTPDIEASPRPSAALRLLTYAAAERLLRGDKHAADALIAKALGQNPTLMERFIVASSVVDRPVDAPVTVKWEPAERIRLMDYAASQFKDLAVTANTVPEAEMGPFLDSDLPVTPEDRGLWISYANMQALRAAAFSGNKETLKSVLAEPEPSQDAVDFVTEQLETIGLPESHEAAAFLKEAAAALKEPENESLGGPSYQ